LDDGSGPYDPAYNLPANELKTDMGLESADPFTPDAGPVDPRLDHSIGRRGIPYLDWPGIKVGGVYQNEFLEKLGSGTSQMLALTRPRSMFTIRQTKAATKTTLHGTPGYTAINYNRQSGLQMCY
jgi:hypothetical protein